MARTTRARHPISLYRRRALSHPGQAFLVLAAAMLAVLTLSAVVPLVVLAVGEVAFLGVVPRSRFFQAAIDQHTERVEREEAAAKRMALTARLAEEHRLELEHLEQLATRIRDRIGEEHGQDAFGLGRLLATYARLATAHRTSTEAFRTRDQSALLDQLATLEAMRTRVPAASLGALERRIAVARTRIDVWQRALDDRDRISHELATIGEIIRWMYEECAATTAVRARAELEETLASWQHDGATVGELSELCAEGDGVDATVFALGGDEAIRVDIDEPHQVVAVNH